MKWFLKVSPIPQRYNLKAIHNSRNQGGNFRAGVTNTSKIQSESNSQPANLVAIAAGGVTNTSKIQSESNSQPNKRLVSLPFWCHQYLKDTIWKQFTTLRQFRDLKLLVSPIPQRYNLKAIHNPRHFAQKPSNGVTNTSKIQSESNSQPTGLRKGFLSRCHQYLKDTIWKQFTTIASMVVILSSVSPIPQRYNLKAIHNHALLVIKGASGVTNTSKIQSESNSQRKRCI